MTGPLVGPREAGGRLGSDCGRTTPAAVVRSPWVDGSVHRNRHAVGRFDVQHGCRAADPATAEQALYYCRTRGGSHPHRAALGTEKPDREQEGVA